MSSLAKASVSAVKWSTATTIGRFMLQLIAQVVLARMLGPDVYGIFGMGIVVFNFSYFIATFGFAWSLGQLEEVSEEDIRFAFTWQMIAGLIAGAGLFASADLAAEYFKDPRVIPIVKWMSVVCVLNGFSAVSGYLMNRDLNFKAPGIIQLCSYFVGYICIGIPCALNGLGVNALLAAWLGQCVVGNIATFLCRPHPMRPRWTSPQAGRITRIGATAFATNLVNWACNNIDRGIIGRLLDARSLGFYNAGYNLANMPNSLLISALQPVFLRVGSKMQGQKNPQGKAFGEILGIIWVLLLPAFFSLALTAPHLIQLFYGDSWASAAPVLAALFLGMPAYVMWGMSTPVLWNMGRARYEMLLQLPLIPIAAAGYFAFASHGVFQAAMVTSGLLLLRGMVVGGVAGHLVGIGLGFVFQQMARGALFCGLIYLAQQAVVHLVTIPLHPLVALVLMSAAHTVVCVGVAWLFPRLLGGEAASLIVRFVPPLKARLMPAA
jgi:lipopolysaccharide exporter